MEELKAAPTESMTMEHWEDQLEESLIGTELRRGELREGAVLALKDGGLVVDIGSKRDGFVPREDLENLEDKTFTVGETINVIVTKFRDSDGNVELSVSQAMLQEDWIKAEKLKEEETVYEAKVLNANRGGLTVEFGRLRGFIPMSQLIGFSRIRQAAERHRRLRAMVGQTIMLKVIEVNRRRRRLILSQRAAAKEWRSARREQLMDELEAGQVRRGRISQITDFGLFVNLGGLDGLVHISELSWGRIENPREVYHEGQRIKVKVLSVDHDRQRIALSIKALAPDPWEIAPQKYHEGTLVEGKVTQVVDFGIFVELEPGVEGLLHNSELGDVEQRNELQPGAHMLVKVIRVEPDRRRIGLSVRQVRRDEWEEWSIAKAAEAQAKEQAKATAEVKEDEEDLDDELLGEVTEAFDEIDEAAEIVVEGDEMDDIEADAEAEA
ncbi:MAG TPA: S1 RNA-binding domain-containing protein [Anaerolineae bacterium]|nr:S1 RNA-binding domain-containing protein [Anaerolineae bacterium]HQI84940.1 S1 RNA-binding domain-containing protein [Anaerolineae bacterium]